MVTISSRRLRSGLMSRKNTLILLVLFSLLIVIGGHFGLMGTYDYLLRNRDSQTDSLSHSSEKIYISDRTEEEDCEKPFTGFVNMDRPQYLKTYKNPCWFSANGTFHCLPYFLLAGLAKCGTSDLYQKMLMHPDILPPLRKEPRWWTALRFQSRNGEFMGNISYYLDYFTGAASKILESARNGHPNKITVDASPGTLENMGPWRLFRENCGLREPRFISAHYIQELLPKMKAVVILRNPIERLFSRYMVSEENPSPEHFHGEVLNDMDLWKQCRDEYTLRACAYKPINKIPFQVRLRLGLYHVYVEDWLEVFPREQLHIVRFEDYIKDRPSAIQAISKFLDIRPMTEGELNVVKTNQKIGNSNSELKHKVGPMLNKTRRLLESFYKQYNAKLALLLNDTRYLWA